MNKITNIMYKNVSETNTNVVSSSQIVCQYVYILTYILIYHLSRRLNICTYARNNKAQQALAHWAVVLLYQAVDNSSGASHCLSQTFPHVWEEYNIVLVSGLATISSLCYLVDNFPVVCCPKLSQCSEFHDTIKRPVNKAQTPL